MYFAILLRLILGYLRIEVEGYYTERFINICRNNKILTWNLKRKNGVKLFLNIGVKDFKKLSNIARKTRCRVKIKNKKGIPFLINRYKKRKTFLLFLIIIIALINISSQYVWNIDIKVKDNLQIENIEEDLQELGLKKGIKKSEIDSKLVIDKLRIKRNDISWIGIDLKGTNIIVKIVKSDSKPEILDSNKPCNIIASKDGIITKITAQNGTQIAKVGDTVRKGDVLIAGYMEGKYTDKRFVHSLGEVQAKVWYSKKSKIPYKQVISSNTGKMENKYQIKFNNFQINFYKTLSKFEIYDTIYSEQNIKIFSNFYLPISVVKITNKEQKKEMIEYSENQAKKLGIETLSNNIENEIEDKSKIIR